MSECLCDVDRSVGGRHRARSLHYICRGRKGIISVASGRARAGRGDFRGVVVSIPFYVGGGVVVVVVVVVVGRPSPLFSSPLKLPLFCHDFERTVSFLLCSLSVHSIDRFPLFEMITAAQSVLSPPASSLGSERFPFSFRNLGSKLEVGEGHFCRSR